MIGTMRFIVLMCIISFATYASAQPVTEQNASNKAMKYLDEGVQRAMMKYFDKALISFENAIKEEPNFVTAWQYLGDTHRNMKNDSMVAECYLKVIELDPAGDPFLYMKIAEAEGNMGRYKEALEHIVIFLENPSIKGDIRTKAIKQRKNFEFAKDAVAHPVDFNPQNMGEEVNSAFPEYFPSLSVDGSVLVMTRRIDDIISMGPGDQRPIENEDFYITYYQNGSWTPAESMGEPVNTKTFR